MGGQIELTETRALRVYDFSAVPVAVSAARCLRRRYSAVRPLAAASVFPLPERLRLPENVVGEAFCSKQLGQRVWRRAATPGARTRCVKARFGGSFASTRAGRHAPVNTRHRFFTSHSDRTSLGFQFEMFFKCNQWIVDIVLARLYARMPGSSAAAAAAAAATY